MTLNNEQDAIKQAVENGFEPKYHECADQTNATTHADMFSDPAFWQALGKARGWNGPGETVVDTRTDNPRFRVTRVERVAEWKEVALRYFETKLQRGDLNQFWNTLP